MELSSFPVHDIIIPPLNIFRQEAEARHIELSHVVEPSAEVEITGDPVKLKKIMYQYRRGSRQKQSDPS